MESPEDPQGHSCPCSSSGSDEHNSNYGTRRVINSQDLPESLDMSQNPFLDQIGRFDSSFQRMDERQPVEHPTHETPRYGLGAYSSRNVDLARSLAAEITRRSQESSNRQDHPIPSARTFVRDDDDKLDTRSTDESTKRDSASPDGHHEDLDYLNDSPYKPDNYGMDEYLGHQVRQPAARHHHYPRKASLKMSKMSHGHTLHSPTFSHLHPTSSGSQESPRSSPMNTDGNCSSPNVHYRGNSSDATTRCEPEKDEMTTHERRLMHLSGASSSSSLLNHGSSPLGNRRQSNPATAPLMGYHQETSSGSSNPNQHQHYHHRRRRHHSRRPGSGLYYESSGISSSPNTCRSHSRLDHVHEHRHQHPQQRPPQSPPCGDRRPREGGDPTVTEYHNHHHSHATDLNQYDQTEETKSGALVDIDAGIQVMTPSKSKCQCHAVQPMERGKKQLPLESNEIEGSNGHIAMRRHQPPALPPRPPPRPTRRYDIPTSATHQRHVSGEGGCCKKYVVLCCLCGGLSAAVGSLFMAIHAVLSAHTASLDLFETLPSYVPGAMLIVMGLLTMLLSRRKHRYGLLMKVCGFYGVFCALICLFVTVTTTVTHMSRLQGLRECVYTSRARSCTCYGTPQSGTADSGVIFEGTPHCEAVHGALYACLCALFGVSVAGILACIFSCMLVYQLLTHEKKKMYWEQLELRCRSLYGQGVAPGDGGAIVGARQAGSCGCCNDCGGAGSWWAQTPGNLYTPNPDLVPSRRWRLPWSRSRGPAPSPDSNYGFHTQVRQSEVNPAEPVVGPYNVLGSQNAGPYSVLQNVNHNRATYSTNPGTGAYSVLEGPVPLWGPPPPYSDPNSPARRPQVLVQVPIPEARTRMTKRLQENLEAEEDYGRTSMQTKRPFDNYENADDLATITEPITEVERPNIKGTGSGHDDGTVNTETIRTGSRRSKKLLLRGVENGAFQQQETTSGTKQSESELYFGDVSSCCGPESSIYDLALDKEGGSRPERQEMGSNYHSARHGKRQSSRSRHPFTFAHTEGTVEVPSNSSYSSICDEPATVAGHSSQADTQYEIIQQSRYGYYEPSNIKEGPKSESVTPSRVCQQETRDLKDDQRNDEYCDYRESNPRRIEDGFMNSNEDWDVEDNSRTSREDDDSRSVEV